MSVALEVGAALTGLDLVRSMQVLVEVLHDVLVAVQV